MARPWRSHEIPSSPWLPMAPNEVTNVRCPRRQTLHWTFSSEPFQRSPLRRGNHWEDTLGKLED
jgi:hypothetical protein